MDSSSSTAVMDSSSSTAANLQEEIEEKDATSFTDINVDTSHSDVETPFDPKPNSTPPPPPTTFGTLGQPQEVETEHVCIRNVRFKGFKRDGKTFLPFQHVMRELGVTDGYSIKALNRKKDRLGIPVYHALTAESRVLKSDQVIPARAKRTVLSTVEDIRKIILQGESITVVDSKTDKDLIGRGS